jgi:CRP/FNR family transcriptional regulator, cyclic AMP receptor protein
MKGKFEGSGRSKLLEALLRQEFVSGDVKLANALAERGELLEFQKGKKLITEEAEDDDIFLLTSRSGAVIIKGNQINTRKAGQHVGEMAAIEPAQKRSASIVALETVGVTPSATFGHNLPPESAAKTSWYRLTALIRQQVRTSGFCFIPESLLHEA